MSNEVITLAKKRIVGSPTAKAVLMYMADAASDDGSGVWTSKSNMAADLELSKRTVQICIAALCDMGLIREAGQKKCDRGFTVEYAINLAAVEALPSTRQKANSRGESDSPVQEIHPKRRTRFTPTGESDSPKPSLEPSLEPNTRGAVIDLFGAEAPKSQEPDVEDQFRQFWEVFPKKQNISKKTARAKFGPALKKAGFERIMGAARAYAASRVGEDPKYTCAPDVWLNQERWETWQPEPDPDRARYQAIIARNGGVAR